MHLRIALLLALVFSLANSRGQEILRLELLKGAAYHQTSTGDPLLAAQNPFVFKAIAHPSVKSFVVGNPKLRAPAGGEFTLSTSPSEEFFKFEQSSSTLAGLNAFPAGQYNLIFTGQFSGSQNIALTFSAGTLPATPKILNFSAAQNIDATTDFVLSWAAFPGTADNRRVVFQIFDSAGLLITSSPDFSEQDALTGADTSFLIAAGSLEPGTTYAATLAFHTLTDAEEFSLPFLYGSSYAETHFSLKTRGSSSGADTTPPVLVQTVPSAGFVFTQPNFLSFPVVFQFDEPMATSTSISWSSNVDPSKISCQWVDPTTLSCNYTGGWPAAAQISWKLNPTAAQPNNFKNLAGLDLAANAFTGNFTTGPGSNTPGPCEGNDGVPFTILKSVSYIQDSTGTLLLDLSRPPAFAAALHRVGTNTSTASLQFGGRTESLTNATINGMTHKTFYARVATLGELDLQFPAGSYILQDESQITVNLGAGAYPAVPKFIGLPLPESASLAGSLTLQWEPFTGTGVTSIEISDVDGAIVFRAPDPCSGRELSSSTTSIVVPAGTLQDGKSYQLHLTRMIITDQKPFPGTTGNGIAALVRTTSTTLKSQTTPPLPAIYNKITRTQRRAGELHLEFAGAPGRKYQLEASANLTPPVLWNALETSVTGTTPIIWTNRNDADFSERYYRVRELSQASPLVATINGVARDVEHLVSTNADNSLALKLITQDNTTFSFTLPDNSVSSSENLTFNLVTSLPSLPFSSGLFAAAELSRWNIQFISDGVLKVTFPIDPDPSLVAFGLNPANTNEYFLLPSTKSGRDITVQVTHGGVIGFAVATPAEVQAFGGKTLVNFADQLDNETAVQQYLAANASLQRQSATRPGRSLDDYRQLFTYPVRPQLRSGPINHNWEYALAVYRLWHRGAVRDGLAGQLQPEIQEGNNWAIALLEGETNYLEPLVRAHNHNAIFNLLALRKYIEIEPWRAAFPSARKQALYDRIRKLLRFQLEFDSATDLHSHAGVVRVRVASSTPFYLKGDPRDRDKFLGESPLSFTERTHYALPSPCTVQVNAPQAGNIGIVGVNFDTSATPDMPDILTPTKYTLRDLNLGAYLPALLEGFKIVCPDVTLDPTYWWPQLASFYLYTDNLFRMKLADGFDRLGFEFKSNWAVTPSGNAVIATKRVNRDTDYDGAILFEDTSLRLVHAPQ